MDEDQERERLRLKADLAALKLRLALIAAAEGIELKRNFNPSQPRAPKGRSDGGQWILGGGGDNPRRLSNRGRFSRSPRRPLPGSPAARDPTWEAIKAEARKHGAEVEAFLERNRTTVNRVAGGAQAVFGAVEMVGGVAGVTGGAATAGAAVGLPVAAAASWMVANGYDNWATGWRAFLTGEEQETTLHKTLRQLGLSEKDADATELLLAGFGGVGAAKAARLPLKELDAAAKQGLERRALFDLARKPLDILGDGTSIWTHPDITVRGAAWEAFDAKRTGFKRLHPTSKTFDQFDEATGTAVSNKTLDLTKTTYTKADNQRLYARTKIYIDQAAYTSAREIYVLQGKEIKARRLHLLLPADKALPAQALQLEAAKHYAAQCGVVLQIDYAR